jgi:cytoplasmic iron level regulating protein YaaA (DUF328/UPF0246 family)
MKLITAPSKTQQYNGRTYAEHSLPALFEQTKVLSNLLKLIDRQELSRLMKISDRLTESTYNLIQSFSHPLSPENAKQALFTFQGAAYGAITADAYTKEQLHHAQEHLFILSGFYGILRPLDLMQPYRLEMGCSISVGKAANLYRFWQTPITNFINQSLREDSDKILINLASKEYSRVVDQKSLQGEMVTIIFKQLHKGKFRTIPIHAKKARGLMIHFVISQQIDEAAKLKTFNLDGYCFSKEDSTATEWVFLKKE